MLPSAILLALAVCGQLVVGYNPRLATTQCCRCTDLQPDNAPITSEPQRLPSPFHITVNRRHYNPGEEVQLNLTADPGNVFRSFVVVAYRALDASNTKEPVAVGSFTLLGNILVEEDCLSPKGKALRSNDGSAKSLVKLVWIGEEYYGHIQFRATFIVDDEVYWVREKSLIIKDPTAPPMPVQRSPPRVIDPINTAECGNKKGCYRVPEGCWEPYCEYIATWKDMGQIVLFEWSAITEGLEDRYVAIGFSNDTYMGDDSVMECVHNSFTERTEVFMSYNYGSPNKNVRLPNPKVGIVKEEGSLYNQRVRCRAWREKFPTGDSRVNDLTGQSWHMMIARGAARRGVLQRHGAGAGAIPAVSPEKISMQRKSNIGGRASYPLVKAHACLMFLAWVFFGSIAVLMTKYFKNMWPNRRFYEQRYWFVAHFNFMAMCFLLTVIGFILIFIEADGYSEFPDLPQRAHPILGIIIFICVLINPILALIRPDEENRCRPVFNWFHWAFGTIAFVLMIPQIFIGMDFGKAMVPWWATWIVMLWALCHIIIELSLEVHQCCTHKKNKERRKKYEHQKRENPKLYIPEPEPAGRRFKRFMLFLHVVITSIVTLIMIIVFAVA
ncbi:ferric-chelate reductase 1 [Patella vulgata]|uniref:ferric-chelate reductase 1 n=1 Tax=Patella vulgata TaxID=6465 RepID=UPI00217FDF22|nr:ferric-chelate reductase 1 [Patella vulgata]XP_050400922.1 ferric-chelate reductase 1 [Patella vulgata]XP_050400923.1 ferric-chelate reductase 1 [Patella vulgata]